MAGLWGGCGASHVRCCEKRRENIVNTCLTLQIADVAASPAAASPFRDSPDQPARSLSGLVNRDSEVVLPVEQAGR